MVDTAPTSLRLPSELLTRVDEYAARLEEAAGVPVSRAAAVVKLLTDRLNELEPKNPAAKLMRATRRLERAKRR